MIDHFADSKPFEIKKPAHGFNEKNTQYAYHKLVNHAIQLPVISCRLSVVSGQLLVVSGQLLVVSGQLPVGS
jgi:hypothetical protein